MRLLANGSQGPAVMPAATAPVGTPGYAYNGAPGVGVSVSDLGPDDYNILMAELMAILAAAGITPDATGANTAQVLAALKILFPQNTYYAADAGVANALVVTLSPIPTALSAGMRIYVKVAATCTGASTINANGLGAVAITNPDGSALKANQLVAGGVAEIVYGGATWCLLSIATSYAALAGSASQAFSVAAGVSSAQAVNLGQFAGSLGAAGYQKLPSGLIMQWGSVVCSSAQTATSQNFPITFPTGYLKSFAGSLSLNSYAGIAETFTSAAAISVFSSNAGGAVSYVAFGN